MHDASAAIAATKPQARSRISNGTKFLPGADGRSTWARRARDVHAQLVADRGGPDAVSQAETLIARRAAVIEAELERWELIFATAGQAEPDDLNRYQTAANTQRRLLESLGLERRSRDVTASLPQFIENLQREKARQMPADASAASEGGSG